MSTPGRPTDEQVDTALTHVACGYTGPGTARVLAAEVLALRTEKGRLQDGYGFEMGMRAAAIDQLETLRRELWSLLDADQLSDDDTLDRLRTALTTTHAGVSLPSPNTRTSPDASRPLNPGRSGRGRHLLRAT